MQLRSKDEYNIKAYFRPQGHPAYASSGKKKWKMSLDSSEKSLRLKGNKGESYAIVSSGGVIVNRQPLLDLDQTSVIATKLWSEGEYQLIVHKKNKVLHREAFTLSFK